MVLHDLLRDRETQSRAVLLAMADEWLKQFVVERGFHPVRTVDDADFRVPVDPSQIHRDMAAANLRCLAAIQQQVVEYALHLAGIELRAVQSGRFKIGRASCRER